jgi:hypothetical protein
MKIRAIYIGYPDYNSGLFYGVTGEVTKKSNGVYSFIADGSNRRFFIGPNELYFPSL